MAIFGGDRKHFSGQVNISPSEHILRVTRPNGECCQDLVFNTVVKGRELDLYRGSLVSISVKFLFY